MSDTIFSQIDEAIAQLQTLGQDESIHAIRLLRIHARAAEQQVATLTAERDGAFDNATNLIESLTRERDTLREELKQANEMIDKLGDR